jgi:hypothetical protein
MLELNFVVSFSTLLIFGSRAFRDSYHDHLIFFTPSSMPFINCFYWITRRSFVPDICYIVFISAVLKLHSFTSMLLWSMTSNIFSTKIGRFTALAPLREGKNCANFLVKLSASSTTAKLIHPSPQSDHLELLSIDSTET